MKADTVQLSQLVDPQDPRAILEEIRTILLSMHPDLHFGTVEGVFVDVVSLFRGDYPGYRRCTTDYHNLQHTTDVVLALTRLIHGASIEGKPLSKQDVVRAVLAGLFHDTGYIQQDDDREGTGAKYSRVHVQRGIEFMKGYFSDRGFSSEDLNVCRSTILCTELGTNVDEIPFPSPTASLLGRLMGAADLVGQMADRIYLERLLFLYYEFKEGNVDDYRDETDLLRRTLDFYAMARERLAGPLRGVNRYMAPHFKQRWKIKGDPYETAIEKNRKYLVYLVENHQQDHRDYLRRGRIVQRLREEGK